MKPKFRLLFTVFLCSISSILFAQSSNSFTVNSITYNITSLTVPFTVAVTSVSNNASNIVISSTVEYNSIIYTVTAIANFAFSNCTFLTSVTIPEPVTSIAASAFQQCSSLTSIDVDTKNITYNSYDGLLYNKNLTDLILCPKGKSGDLTNFPSSLASIEANAFHSCSNLTSVIFPSSVTSIGQWALAYCYNLASVTIPNSVTSIADYTFYGSGRLTSIIIPNSLGSIGNRAFSQCASLISVTIPNSVTSIGNNAFDQCTILTSFTVDPLNPNFNTFDGILCDKNLTTLICCPGGKAGSVTIPNSITSIKDYAFSFCIGLTSINIPSSVISIGKYAFNWCRSLTSITIPSSVTSIEDGTFNYCLELVTVDISNSVKSIGNMAFNCCRRLTSISLSGLVNFIGEGAFYNCQALTSFNIPSSVNFISKETFMECYSLTSVTISNSVTSISENAFYECRALTSINIPNSVTSIGENAFMECRSLASVNITSPETTIGKNAFFNCWRLSSINIPSSITSIEDGTFVDCESLTAITLPNSVKFIGNKAFEACIGLTAIHIKGSAPVDLSNSLNVFYRVNTITCILYVPIGSKPTYQSALVWKDFVNIVEEGNPPVANAGADQAVNEGTTVPLDGTSSADSDGNTLAYLWKAPTGITLSSTTVAKPTFTAPEVSSDKQFTFTLKVNNGTLDSSEDQVVITVKQVNKAPVANAGADQAVNEGLTTTLDGTGSTDADGNILTFLWTAPAGITLSSTTSVNPTFTAPEVSADTQFIFTLKVNNGALDSSEDQVIITVTQVNKAPVANAGADQAVNEGVTATLDGTGSTDADGNTLTYLWTAPSGITLSSTTSLNPTFTAPQVTSDVQYTFTLVVNDGRVSSIADFVVITIKQVPPTLTMTAIMDNEAIPVSEISYLLYQKNGTLFEAKTAPEVIMGNEAKYSVEPGDWIVLVSSVKNPTVFTPTYVGNVISWANAEIISIPESGNITRAIKCVAQKVTSTGPGTVIVSVYEKILTKAWSSNSMGNLLSGTLVYLFRKGETIPVLSGFTDANGIIKFEKLELGDYEIIVEVPGFTQLQRLSIKLTNDSPSFPVVFAVNTLSGIITEDKTLPEYSYKIFPNPFTGSVTIDVGSSAGQTVWIEVYGMQGNHVELVKLNTSLSLVDLSKLVPGEYLVKVRNGNETRSQILIKK